MSMLPISVIPLIKELTTTPEIKQVCYADDATADGSINGLWEWWSVPSEHGPAFSYYPNPRKTWIIVKLEFLETASVLF